MALEGWPGGLVSTWEMSCMVLFLTFAFTSFTSITTLFQVEESWRFPFFLIKKGLEGP
jgi:hypothetical protein